jgi:hypothetical protein
MRTVLALLIALSLGGVQSTAAQASRLTPEQRDAFLGFSLTLDRANHLITAMTGVTQYLTSQPDWQQRLRQNATLTSAEQAARMEKDPTISGILKKNGLTAREYLVGVPTLRMALMTAQGLASPNIVASPANVAFAKANLAELKPKMEQADLGGLGRGR